MANIQQPITPMQDPVMMQNPDYVRQMLQAQQRAKMADALLQQGMQPIEYDRRGRVSWTQGLAKALSAGLGAWGGLNNAENQAGLQAQGIQRQLDMLGAGTQPTGVALADAIDPRPAAALSQGAAQGSIGPTLDNAARMNAMPQPAQQPTNGVPGGVAPNGNNPYGLPPMLLLQAQMGNEAAKEQIKTLLSNQQFTPAQKEWRDPLGGQQALDNLRTQNMTEMQKLQLARSRVPDGSPMAQQLDAAIQKANYVAPAEVSQGNLVLDRNNMPIFYNPKTADGVVPTFQTQNGFTMPTGARALPGYARANASIAGAEQGARQANTVFTNVPGPDGSPQSGFLFGGGGGGGGVPSAGGMRGQPPAAVVAPGGRPGVISGPSTTDAAIQKSAADAVAQAPQTIQQSRIAVTGLESALRALEGVRATGPGTVKTSEVLAAVGNTLGIKSDGVNQYQALGKFLSNSLNQAAQGTGASGSDARFESFMHGQPNQETMSKPALDGAIRYVLSQHDAAAARGQFIFDAYNRARAAGDPNAAQTAAIQWSQVYKPDYFAFNRMSQGEQSSFLKSKGKDAGAWVQQYNDYAHKTGWVR